TRTLSKSEMPAESTSLGGYAVGQGLGAWAAGRERARHEGRGVVERVSLMACAPEARRRASLPRFLNTFLLPSMMGKLKILF
ncbi:MAG: hypothetical protein WB993_05415, partial [Candidatus Sulfotelmatobacter sp.]